MLICLKFNTATVSHYRFFFKSGCVGGASHSDQLRPESADVEQDFMYKDCQSQSLSSESKQHARNDSNVVISDTHTGPVAALFRNFAHAFFSGAQRKLCSPESFPSKLIYH